MKHITLTMLTKYPDGIADTVDPDQTAPCGSSLIWVCIVCSDQSIPKLSISMVDWVLLYQVCVKSNMISHNEVVYGCDQILRLKDITEDISLIVSNTITIMGIRNETRVSHDTVLFFLPLFILLLRFLTT